jgi:hypothetical protein
VIALARISPAYPRGGTRRRALEEGSRALTGLAVARVRLLAGLSGRPDAAARIHHSKELPSMGVAAPPKAYPSLCLGSYPPGWGPSAAISAGWRGHMWIIPSSTPSRERGSVGGGDMRPACPARGGRRKPRRAPRRSSPRQHVADRRQRDERSGQVYRWREAPTSRRWSIPRQRSSPSELTGRVHRFPASPRRSGEALADAGAGAWGSGGAWMPDMDDRVDALRHRRRDDGAERVEVKRARSGARCPHLVGRDEDLVRGLPAPPGSRPAAGVGVGRRRRSE